MCRNVRKGRCLLTQLITNYNFYSSWGPLHSEGAMVHPLRWQRPIDLFICLSNVYYIDMFWHIRLYSESFFMPWATIFYERGMDEVVLSQDLPIPSLLPLLYVNDTQHPQKSPKSIKPLPGSRWNLIQSSPETLPLKGVNN